MAKSIFKEVVGAFSVPIILSILKKGDNYGYEIVQWVNKATNDVLNWQEASVYPVLKKLEENGLIKSYWKVIENERPRKYYTILADGLKQLDHNMQEWNTVVNLFEKLNNTD